MITKLNFTHINYPPKFLPEINMRYISGKRFYETPCGIFPSITTVLSCRHNSHLEKWRRSVGAGVADHIARSAAIRGNCTHKIIEDYLRNKEIVVHENKVLPMALFNILKNTIDRINNIHALETPMFNTKYGVAGRVDTIADFDGKLSIIDFKTSTKAKKKEWIENYFIQETAYSLMWEEQTNDKISQIVTIIASEDGEVHTFLEKRNRFIPKLNYCINEFYFRQKSLMKRLSNKKKTNIEKQNYIEREMFIKNAN